MKLKAIAVIILSVLTMLPNVRAESSPEDSKNPSALYCESSINEFSDIIPVEAQTIGNDAGAIAGKFTVGHLIDLIADELGELFLPVTRQLAMLLGVVIVISMVNAAKASLSNAGLSSAMEYATLLCTVLTAYSAVSNVWDRMSDAMASLTVFMTGLIPMMGTLYVAGGNVTAAAVSSAGLMTLTAFCEQLASYVLWPVLRICFGFALITGLGGQICLTGISQTLRNMFAGALAFIMATLTAVLGYQTNLALSADNLSAKTFKFAAASYIPVVGGALGDAVRAIGGSIGVLRATLGTAAVAVVFVLVLPAILQLFLCRFVFSLTAAAAKLAGCDRESAFFEEMRGMLGFGLAILISCAVMFLIFITMFSSAATGIIH